MHINKIEKSQITFDIRHRGWQMGMKMKRNIYVIQVHIICTHLHCAHAQLFDISFFFPTSEATVVNGGQINWIRYFMKKGNWLLEHKYKCDKNLKYYYDRGEEKNEEATIVNILVVIIRRARIICYIVECWNISTKLFPNYIQLGVSMYSRIALSTTNASGFFCADETIRWPN